MSVSNYIPLNIDIATINTNNISKNIFLPATSSIYGKTISIKDITGFASSNNIIVRSQGVDRFQDSTSNYIINKNFGVASFFAKSNIWYLMNDNSQVNSNLIVNSVRANYYYGDGSALSNTGFGLSSLSSIVAYGLSSIYSPTGVSSLSSIVAYGLSTVAGGSGVSSLSSIVAYGLSTVAGGSGISSLSSIVAYGLSSVYGGEGISSLSSIISYGLSTVSGSEGISSLSSIVAYGLSTVAGGSGVSSLSSIVAYGLSTVSGGHGLSSLSSIVSYGLSTVSGGYGLSSLSSIVSYGLSSVSGGDGISSLSSILSYALSSVYGGEGISSLSSIVSYGLSSVSGGHGISSLSSIISYGLSTVSGGRGVSSLSSIISYGLSTVAGGRGISSLSSIVSYGLSSVSGGHGLSSLSSIVSYGLSSINPGQGVSSLSSIVAYGLSSLKKYTDDTFRRLDDISSGGGPTPGVSSLSSIIAYGLSSVQSNIQSVRNLIGAASGILGPNTWNLPEGFYPASIGGAGIRDINNEPTDTVTNAIAKLDSWIYKNIVDQPTAPSYFGKSNSISTINYYWTNPQQFKIGILNIFSPYISSLNMNLYSNATLFSSFIYSDPHLENSRFTVEGVEFISTDSNRPISLVNHPLFGNRKTLRIPIDSTKFNNINPQYSLELYFQNYSSNSYKILDLGSNNLDINVGIPAPPQSVSFTNIGITNAFIEIRKPDLHSVNPNLLEFPSLDNYQITLCNIEPAPRRYTTSVFSPSITFQDSNYSYIAPLQSNPLGNILNADSTYIATVRVKNIIKNDYSEGFAFGTFRTLLPNEPKTLTEITALSNGDTNTQSVFGNISNAIVYNRNTFDVGGGLQFITNSNLGIHSSNNPGSNNTNIASISLIVTSGSTGADDTNILNLNGYPIVASTRSNSNANTIITAQNIRDFYTDNITYSNFFMSFTGHAMLKKNYLVGASNPYRISIRHSNTGFNCNFTYSNFYIDDLPAGPPSLANITISSNTVLYYSGVPSYFNQTDPINENGNIYSDSVLFNFSLSNLARYFFIKDQSLLNGSINYKGDNLCNINHTCNTLLYTEQNIPQNIAPLSNISIIKSGFHIPSNIFTEANNNGSRLLLNISLSNLNGISNIVERRLPFYIDTLSRTNFIRNPMIRSPYLDPGSSYNYESLISNTGINNYNSELPYVGGLFRTGCNLSNLYDSFSNFQVPFGLSPSSYSNLSNYSLIKNETGVRFASFYITCNSPNIQTYINKVTINFSNQFGLVLINSNYNNLVVTNFIAYRGSNGDTNKYDTITISNIRSNISPFSGIHGTRPDFPITSNSRTISIPPYNINTIDRRFYIGIGLKMNCNVSFENINVVFGSNFAPPSPANVSLTKSANNLTLNWETPANCNSPLDNYRFNIIPSCNSTRPRRWVSAGFSIIQEPYFSNVICNVFVPDTSQLYPFTTYQYTGIASNYDTPYTGQVSLTNDAATSGFSNSVQIITDLPLNNGSEFTGILGISGTSVNYLNNGIIFANRSGGSILNTSIYASNLLFTSDRISRQFITNTDITVNPQDGYIGFKNNTTVWTIQLCNITSSTTIRSANFNFTAVSGLFGSVSISNINIATSDGCFLLLSNVRDMYSNNIYQSRFYLLATPIITLSNTIIPPSSNLYRLSLTDSSRFITNYNEFYVENIIGAPSGSLDVENTGDITFCNICGVSVITSTRFNFWITTTNIGNHFFYDPPVTASNGNMSGTFSFDSVNTPFYWNNNTGSPYTRGPISNTTYFYWSNVQVTNSNFNQSYPLTGTVNNILNTGVSLGGGSFTPYFDFESIPLMNCNVRVESGGTISNYPASGTFGAPYNHNTNIGTDSKYKFELQLSKGAFRSAPRDNTCFLNYSPYFPPLNGISRTDYSSFDTSITFRFVTFKHSFSILNNCNRVDLLSINLRWADRIPNVTLNNYDADKFKFYIRFNSNTPTQSNDSSEWLIVQSNNSPFRSYITKNNSNDTLGVASRVVNLVTGSNPIYTIAVPEGCGYGNFDVYTRVGLSTGFSGGYSLSNIIVNISNEVNVTNQFNFNCNTSATNTTISFITPFGLPSNTYFRLSNILYKSNAGSFVEFQTSNIRMSPTINSNILTIQNLDGSTYSNTTTIFSATDTVIYRSNYRFSVSNAQPVPIPRIFYAGNMYTAGESAYNALVRLFTIGVNCNTPNNIKTYYFTSNATNNAPGPGGTGNGIRGPATYSNISLDQMPLIYIFFDTLRNGHFIAYNSNTDTGALSLQSNILLPNPTYVAPAIVDPPTFSKISFNNFVVSAANVVTFTINSAIGSVIGTTSYSWSTDPTTRTTNTASNVSLSNQVGSSGASYTISGFNRNSGNNSVTTSSVASYIYIQTGEIPEFTIRDIYLPTGTYDNFNIVITNQTSPDPAYITSGEETILDNTVTPPVYRQGYRYTNNIDISSGIPGKYVMYYTR